MKHRDRRNAVYDSKYLEGICTPFLELFIEFYSIWIVWTRRNLDVWRLGITWRCDEWEEQRVLMWKYWSWETIATNNDIFMHVAEYFSLGGILLDQTIVPDRTQPYRHHGRFKIQKNVQLKASNQPGAQPMGSIRLPSKRGNLRWWAHLIFSNIFQKQRLQVLYLKIQSQRYLMSFNDQQKNQPFSGHILQRDMGGQR